MANMLVVGAGTMGRGIAHVAALSGFDVALTDRKGVDVAPAVAMIRAEMDKGAFPGKTIVDEAAKTITFDMKDSEAAAMLLTDDGYNYVIMPLARDK